MCICMNRILCILSVYIYIYIHATCAFIYLHDLLQAIWMGRIAAKSSLLPGAAAASACQSHVEPSRRRGCMGFKIC